MAKKGSISRSKKRHFQGNQHTLKKKKENASQNAGTFKSASAKKLGLDHEVMASPSSCSKENFVYNSDVAVGYRIIHISSLIRALSDNVCCKICHSEIILEETSVQGLASTFNFRCNVCNSNKQFYSSPKGNNTVCEINRRMVYAMRCIGQGLGSIQLFCGLMDLPPPVKQSTYAIIVGRIVSASKLVAKQSMQRAVEEEIKLSSEPDKREISISGDGSWKTRGHMSRYGIVSVIGAESGKVIDVKVKSSYCRTCNKWKGKKRGPKYDNLMKKHGLQCTANHQGSAASMECCGLQDIFNRSERKYNVKYTEYIGDGDTKSFKAVHDSMPYGPHVDIKKVECVGHVQKRMGTRLRNMKKKLSGKKLADGKGIGGAGRLTDAVIDKLQVYYGNAIRGNKNKIDEMRNAIWAIWYPEASTDSDPQHYMCPSGEESWCGYRRAQADDAEKSYKHPHPIPMAVMKEIKPIFKDLVATDLLKRCVKRRTQNPNESFNNRVWAICPKTTNSGYKIVKIAAADAVATFNEGNTSRLQVLKHLDVTVEKFAETALGHRDILRVKSAEKRVRESTKEARRTRRRLRLEENGRNMSKEGTTYAAGAF